MTDLRRLNVSLTKHGAHKIATLLQRYSTNDVLSHLSGSERGINIELAQAKKTLAADRSGKIPKFWNQAKRNGEETLKALVLVAIILSHHELIEAMKGSINKRPFSGKIKRGKNIVDKAFSNLKNNIKELGFSAGDTYAYVKYDLQKLFELSGFNKLMLQLLELKLASAGWDRKNSVVDEAISLGLHEVFSLSEERFRAWLTVEGSNDLSVDTEDASFFFDATDEVASSPFKFKPGHNQKKTGPVPVRPSGKESSALLLHNEIQNSLYSDLVETYGKNCVGTENSTGQGTSIDIVVKTSKFCWFYEIKTVDSVKGCIRQALPQLLEYAYWNTTEGRADRLIVVSPLPITTEARRYLDFLQKKFQLMIYYEHHAPSEKILA